MKQVTLMDLLDSSIFNTNSLAPTLYLSESDENYLNRENKDKVFSLVKMSEKKKQLKLSSLFKIFSKRKIYDTSYVFEKVVEWCRSKLQFVGENDNRDVIFSTELKNAMGDNPYSNYVLNTLFYSYGYSELIPYKCKTEESKDQFIDETSITPMVYTAYKLRKSLRGSKWYYRTHPHLSKEIIGDVCVPMAMAVIFNELSKKESIEEIAKEIAINSLKDFIDGEVIYYSIEAEKEEFEKISNILDIKFVRLETDQAQFNGKRVMVYANLPVKTCAALSLLGYCPDSLRNAREIYIRCFGSSFMTSFSKYLVEFYCTKVLAYDVEIKDMIEYNKRTSSEYAHSFETKKNIPLNIQKAMQESDFHNFFGGFVEFDELCDVKKIRVLEKEWRALAEKHFNATKFNNVSLRFRRLGNHKASGLYYPAFRCICVDINNPSSMVHEFGHMIDDGSLSGIGGDYLSLKPDFDQIKEVYREHIDSIDMLKERKGKYSADYYKNATEIFARSFEMYVSRVLGVSNSLLEDLHSFEYPDDEEFMSMVKEYFDRLFKVLFEGGKSYENECNQSDS